MEALDLDFTKRRTACYARATSQPIELNDQLRDLRIFCLRNYITNTELFTDSHLQCSKAQARPGFAKMIRTIQAGEIECVVVSSISSFARSSSDFLKCLEILRKHQVSLVALEENFSFDTSSVALAQFISLISRLENDHLREKVRSGMKRVQAQGKPIGRSRTRNDTLIHSLLNSGLSVREAARIANCSPSTVAASKKTRNYLKK
jgi:DNA invertase Pin-like site-specific DNA recombinase